MANALQVTTMSTTSAGANAATPVTGLELLRDITLTDGLLAESFEKLQSLSTTRETQLRELQSFQLAF